MLCDKQVSRYHFNGLSVAEFGGCLSIVPLSIYGRGGVLSYQIPTGLAFPHMASVTGDGLCRCSSGHNKHIGDVYRVCSADGILVLPHPLSQMDGKCFRGTGAQVDADVDDSYMVLQLPFPRAGIFPEICGSDTGRGYYCELSDSHSCDVDWQKMHCLHQTIIRMKILHVITSLLTGGAEVLVVNLMPRFRALGHQVGDGTG